MANDILGQVIPSWVEDNSYQIQSKATFAINDGHPSPCSLTEFRTFWKNMFDGAVVRDGKMKDNTAYNGKFLIDKQRTFNKVEELPENLNVTGETNVDGGQPATIPMLSGEDGDDTTNYGQGQWAGNSGLEVYAHPLQFYNGSTEVTSTDEFDSVVRVTSWKLASDYKKASINEYNPIDTVANRTLKSFNAKQKEMEAIAPDSTTKHLTEEGRGETYTTKIACANDFLVSGMGLKFKIEVIKDSENMVPEVDRWRITNGYGRVAFLNEWVTHCPKVIGQARIYKEIYDFTGGQRVSTTLQDVNSGVFGLPAGHPIVEIDQSELQGTINFVPHFPDEMYGAGQQVIPDDEQIKFGE